MMAAEEARTALAAAFPGDEIAVADFSGDSCDGYKLDVRIVSEAFTGMPLLSRHRAVNAALAAMMPRIHALTIKAITPAQAAAAAAKGGAPAPAS
jgi:BolA family transcriptional regulator, general stress-responsive regulator